MKSVKFLAAAFIALMFCLPFVAGAEQVVTAHPGGFPTPVSPTATLITQTYNFVFWITALVAILVEGVILFCIWKFRRAKNKTPAKFSHHTLLEVVWTAIPVLICVAIAVKSFVGINALRNLPEQGLVVEAIAYQFGWDFDYPDLNISVPEATEAYPALSSAGRERYVKKLVVPVGTNIKVNVVARDVLHAFFVPALGVKVDAIPGRINYAWFNAQKEGEYIGQCAELCGTAHGEMFFAVEVLNHADYTAWVNTQRADAGLEPLTWEDIEKTAL